MVTMKLINFRKGLRYAVIHSFGICTPPFGCYYCPFFKICVALYLGTIDLNDEKTYEAKNKLVG